MLFSHSSGLLYNAGVHDFVEENGGLASAERVAEALDTSVEEVEQDRQAKAQLRSERAEFLARHPNGGLVLDDGTEVAF